MKANYSAIVARFMRYLLASTGFPSPKNKGRDPLKTKDQGEQSVMKRDVKKAYCLSTIQIWRMNNRKKTRNKRERERGGRDSKDGPFSKRLLNNKSIIAKKKSTLKKVMISIEKIKDESTLASKETKSK